MASSQYSAGRFALEIRRGRRSGSHRRSRAASASRSVIATTAPSGVVEKKPGPVRYAPIVLEVDASLASDFYDWMTGFLDGNQKPKGGVIRLLDYGLREQSRLEWTDGLITEVAFPAADAGSKDAATLRVTLQPDATRRVDGSGTTVLVAAQSHQKRWLPSNFKFSISGLETATRKANRVDELVLSRPVTGTPGRPRRGNARRARCRLHGANERGGRLLRVVRRLRREGPQYRRRRTHGIARVPGLRPQGADRCVLQGPWHRPRLAGASGPGLGRHRPGQGDDVLRAGSSIARPDAGCSGAASGGSPTDRHRDELVDRGRPGSMLSGSSPRPARMVRSSPP